MGLERSIDDLPRSRYEEMRDERDRYRQALEDLVLLKDGPRGEAYERAKPAAWARARALLASDNKQHEETT